MRKCRNCKTRLPTVKESLTVQKAGFCNLDCKNTYRPAKKAKTKQQKRRKTTAQRANDLAVLLQKLVRLKAADKDGICQCVTCPTRKHWKEMQGGHFIERGRASTKCIEQNINPQCPYCNRYGMKKSSVVLDYRRYMDDMYGKDFVDELVQRSKQPHKHNRQEIEDRIQEVKDLIKVLQ
jgi:hypothetical protein